MGAGVRGGSLWGRVGAAGGTSGLGKDPLLEGGRDDCFVPYNTDGVNNTSGVVEVDVISEWIGDES